ncbi:GIY-YIG nuclease family protein [Anabaena cylindrica UHCC 0172]|uniref:Helicase A859L n=1 Tax=Anabaena cylindrica (strain ATCC 27899 / PCC 7122) TaxID=272123 RepID=K9ZQD6_ANACC|nr:MULTISPECIES: GIY-YIG nuclease family protein [Anabaena]AFZ61438.1 helicase A859L [Anabaena cylindrica PCC 7122]MCM2405961.1 GIY-YIG nuclease family protein [Anabaena sp. CCAP 1446/1C]MEA5551663.1 GIY-YIG nuclease family protein [Anabaena cylindrica UHCC 0172]
MYQYQQHYTSRNDHEPGYIYLMEAVGYHGFLPGCLTKRCKIGLSRNPQLRLQNFHDNQPPCDIQIIKTIYVEDMAAVEAKLHKQFKYCNVKLAKSKEWFDLNPVDLMRVNLAFSRYSSHVIADISPVKISFGLLGIAVLIMALIATQTTPKQQQLEIKPIVERGVNL